MELLDEPTFHVTHSRSRPETKLNLSQSIITHDLILITRDGFGTIHMVDLQTGAKKASLKTTFSIACLACSPSVRDVASAGHDGLVGIWDP